MDVAWLVAGRIPESFLLTGECGWGTAGEARDQLGLWGALRS